VSLLSSDRSRAIRLALRAGRIELLASSPDQGEAHESLGAEYAGPDIEVGFNAQYLVDFLAAAGGDTVKIELKDADSQGVLRPQETTDIEYRYVVMPMRF
jgi:DNA polymerase-3 subunit beta